MEVDTLPPSPLLFHHAVVHGSIHGEEGDGSRRPSSPWPHHPPQSCAIVPSREVVENIWKLRGVLTCPRGPLSPSPSPTTGEGHAGWCLGDLDMCWVMEGFREVVWGGDWGRVRVMAS